jgi:hypothetical protein
MNIKLVATCLAAVFAFGTWTQAQAKLITGTFSGDGIAFARNGVLFANGLNTTRIEGYGTFGLDTDISPDAVIEEFPNFATLIFNQPLQLSLGIRDLTDSLYLYLDYESGVPGYSGPNVQLSSSAGGTFVGLGAGAADDDARLFLGLMTAAGVRPLFENFDLSTLDLSVLDFSGDALSVQSTFMFGDIWGSLLNLDLTYHEIPEPAPIALILGWVLLVLRKHLRHPR